MSTIISDDQIRFSKDGQSYRITTDSYFNAIVNNLILSHNYDIIIDQVDVNCHLLKFESLSEPISKWPKLFENIFTKNSSKKLNPAIHITNLEIKKEVSISISGLRIGHISISQECMTSIHLTNCWIGGITFKNDGTADDRGPNVSIYGCLIGSFNASSGGRIGDVNIFDSSIQQFKTPLPKQNNPFSGDVNFKNVSLIPFHGIKEFKDLQIYRNLYAHLESNNNFQTSKYIRSLEKRLERTSEESLINKSINYLYDAISFYNYYPDRPLKITAMLFVFMVYISFVFDLTIINNGFDHLDKWFFVGNNTLLNDLFRSFYFSVTSIINPVGVILGKSIVIGKYFFVQLAFSLYGLFNLLLVTISFFGFKKKFNET